MLTSDRLYLGIFFQTNGVNELCCKYHMLSVVMLIDVMLSDAVPSVVMLGVIPPSVVAPLILLQP